ncbi:MAG: DUF2339 domain-containing protein [Gammaproteobacteria bacterium]|nr:DUF2339 domain-containing protein [Gammaproteobacteria bacterium]
MSLMGIIFALVGGFFGGSFWHEAGFVFGLIAGYSLGAVIQLTGKVKALERRLSALPAAPVAEERVHTRETAAPRPQPVEPETPQAETITAAPPAPVVDRTMYQPVAETQTPETTTPVTAQDDPWHRQDTFFDSLFTRIKSFFTDGNVVVKVGVLVLFVGVGFLLKYAAAHSMLPVPLRIAGIGLGGIALLIVGWRLRERKRIYALLLQGGGVGVMYLTVFGAAKLYHLLPVGLAFVVMVALVVLSGILAVLQNAKYLAFYGAAGGFLAPILASTGSGSHVMLFSYYALLNLGIVGIAWYRSWRELNLLGFVFTFVIGSMWGARYYQPAFFPSVEPFLILFFIFFVVIAILFAFRQPPQLKGYVDSTLVFGVPIIVFALQAALAKDMHYGLAFSALAMSAFYIVLASTLWSRGPQGMRLLTEAFLAMGVVFGSLAIPLALDGRWTSAAWALEGAAIVWVGVRQQRTLARAFGLLLQAGSGFFFLSALQQPVHSLPIINGVFVGAMIISLAGLFSSYYLYKYHERLRDWERGLHFPLLVWGACWWFGAGVHEIREFIHPRQIRVNVILTFATASLCLAHFLHGKLKWSMLRYLLLGQLYAMLIVFWVLFGYQVRHPLAWYGWLAWPFAFAALYYFLYRHRESTGDKVLRWQHIIGFWLLVLVLTWEGAWLNKEWIVGHTWRDIMYELVPALIMLLLMTKGRRLRWPVDAHYEWYVGYAGMPIMLGLGVVALFMGLLHEGNPWPITYVPIVNPVDLVVGFILYLLILWRQQLAAHAPTLRKYIKPRPFGLALAAGAFLWLNGIIARSVHHWFGVPHNLHALSDSAIFQASLSVTWTLTAMLVMFLASRRGHRQTWFAGLGLFLVTVAKLFLVDIADKNELTMIISLIVVAVVAIVFGYYLSPLPPRREEKSS